MKPSKSSVSQISSLRRETATQLTVTKRRNPHSKKYSLTGETQPQTKPDTTFYLLSHGYYSKLQYKASS